MPDTTEVRQERTLLHDIIVAICVYLIASVVFSSFLMVSPL